VVHVRYRHSLHLFQVWTEVFFRTIKGYPSANEDKTVNAGIFIGWSVLGLVTALAVEYGFIREFGVAVGTGYSAFLQNLLMSILFITMLVRRGNNEGQSLSIAINKWVGTLAPTILYGVLGEGGFPQGSFLILILGIFCSIFDLIYIRMLTRGSVFNVWKMK